MKIYSAKRNGSRRAFLRGVGGATLGLPLLEYTHGTAWAAGETYAKRFVCVVALGGETMAIHQHGQRGAGYEVQAGSGSLPIVDHWLPSAGAPFGVANQIFQGTDLESKLLVLRGVDNNAAYEQHEYTGGHWMNNLLALTAADFSNHTGDMPSYAKGPSIDYVVAERLAARFPGSRANPLNLLMPPWSYGAPFASGGNGQVEEGEHNPRAAFNSIFEGVMSSGAPDPTLIKRRDQRRSVLNAVMGGYQEFQAKLGMADRRVLEAHFDNLSALEKEIAGIVPTAQCTVPGAPANIADYNDASDQQQVTGPAFAKLIVNAMRCGLTNVASLQIGDFTTPWLYTGADNNVSGEHDGSGHGLAKLLSTGPGLGTNASLAARWEAEMRNNRRFRMSIFKEIADGLNDPSFMEGDRTLLDNSLMLYTSEFSSGGAHVSRDIPYLLMGSAGGYFNTGRFLDFNLKRRADPGFMGWNSTMTNNNVYTSVLNAFGENDTNFGGNYAFKAGPISELR